MREEDGRHPAKKPFGTHYEVSPRICIWIPLDRNACGRSTYSGVQPQVGAKLTHAAIGASELLLLGSASLPMS